MHRLAESLTNSIIPIKYVKWNSWLYKDKEASRVTHTQPINHNLENIQKRKRERNLKIQLWIYWMLLCDSNAEQCDTLDQLNVCLICRNFGSAWDASSAAVAACARAPASINWVCFRFRCRFQLNEWLRWDCHDFMQYMNKFIVRPASECLIYANTGKSSVWSFFHC